MSQFSNKGIWLELKAKESQQYHNLTLKVIDKELKRQASGIIDRIFEKHGDDITAAVAQRMYIFLRDVNSRRRGYPNYAGLYMAEKFGGLFRNTKTQIMVNDLLQIEQYGKMVDDGHKVKPNLRKKSIEAGMQVSRAQFFMKRQSLGISGKYLMLMYKIPPETDMQVLYAGKVESTGWGKTPHYNVRSMLIDFRHYVFNVTEVTKIFKRFLGGGIQI